MACIVTRKLEMNSNGHPFEASSRYYKIQARSWVGNHGIQSVRPGAFQLYLIQKIKYQLNHREYDLLPRSTKPLLDGAIITNIDSYHKLCSIMNTMTSIVVIDTMISIATIVPNLIEQMMQTDSEEAKLVFPEPVWTEMININLYSPHRQILVKKKIEVEIKYKRRRR